MFSAAALTSILGWITAAIKAAPQVAAVYTAAKDFITNLFKGGMISKAQQDALHAHIESIRLMVEAGIVPPHWQVEPDPLLPI